MKEVIIVLTIKSKKEAIDFIKKAQKQRITFEAYKEYRESYYNRIFYDADEDAFYIQFCYMPKVGSHAYARTFEVDRKTAVNNLVNAKIYIL